MAPGQVSPYADENRLMSEVPPFSLIAAALLEYAFYDVLRLCGGLPAVRRALRRRPGRAPATGDAAAIRQARLAAKHGAVLYVRRTLCLQRSFVVTRLLRRRGINAELVMGYLPAPLTAHAWVEVERVVVSDHMERLEYFHVLDRW